MGGWGGRRCLDESVAGRGATRAKLRILSEADEPEISLASVARRHDLCPQQLYPRRRRSRETAEAARPEMPLVFLPMEDGGERCVDSVGGAEVEAPAEGGRGDAGRRPAAACLSRYRTGHLAPAGAGIGA